MNLSAGQFSKATFFAPLRGFLSKTTAQSTAILPETVSINFLRRLSVTINSHRIGIKASAFCLLYVLVQLTCPISSSAQYCMWPTITVVWSVVPGNYTDGSAGFSYGITRTCPTDCCRDVTFLDTKIIIDENEVVGNTYSQPLMEGLHSATAKFTANGGEENMPYSVPVSFTVDKTPPAISLTKPENNSSIPITDVSIAGSVSDTDAKLNRVEVNLLVSSGPCRFHKNFFDATVNLVSIRGNYCDTDYYAFAPTLCSADMGTARASFNLNYNLRDYVDFPEKQDCGFYLTVGAIDRVGNGSLGSDSTAFNSKSIFFAVDQAPPVVTINDPTGSAVVVEGLGMYWSNPDAPVVSGIAKDLSEITKVWLTIKDERTGKWWAGSKWDAKITTLGALIKGTTAVTWDYNLPPEILRSGVFTITAYASDKFGHEGHAVVSGKNKKKYDLGKKDFTSFVLRMKEVINDGAKRSEDNPYTFIAKNNAHDEGVIRVTAGITPERLSGPLNGYVMWNVYGVNAYSGKPNAPVDGNPSVFFVEIPPVPAKPEGRPGPMGYTVFPRVEYDFGNEHVVYMGADHGSIEQDNLDVLRQEYVDLRTGYMVPREGFDQDLPEFPRLLGSSGFEATKHNWHILKLINSKAIALNVLLPFDMVLRPTSGYRCPIGNKSKDVGGEYNSNHMLGRAMDYNQKDNLQNWDVRNTGIILGASENLLYDQRNCRILTFPPFFILPYYGSIKCGKNILNNQKITTFTHGHLAW